MGRLGLDIAQRRAGAALAIALLSCCVWAGWAHAIGSGGSPPGNTGLPEISGVAQVGQTLSCSQGTWTGLPTSFAYAWSRDGTQVPGAAGETYALSDADLAGSMTCTVTATNIDGSTQATSAAAGPVAAAPVAPAPAAPPPAAPAPTPAPLPKPAKVIKLPGKRSCGSRRVFRIRIKAVPGVTFARVAVSVNGKRVKVLKGDRLSARVDLRGLPRGTFAARIEVTTKDGRKLKHTRKYRTCEPRKRGKRKHRL